MIVTRKFARSMDRDVLAELASDYATEFSHLLGYEGEVEIGPNQVISDKEEAKAQFLKKFEPEGHLLFMRGLAKLHYESVLGQINDGSPFVQDGVAFIPVSELSDENGLLARTLEDIFSRRRGYVSLNGFGAEVAHLTGMKIYNNKASSRLDEALDLGSQLFEHKKDIEFLRSQEPGLEYPYAQVLQAHSEGFLQECISERRKQIEIFETLLFEGDSAAMRKSVALGYCAQEDANWRIEEFKHDYLTTTHYDGVKLFVEVFDSVAGELDKAYLRLGSIMSNPKVRGMESALKELGHTPKELARYKGVFDEYLANRYKRLDHP
jgi:hypothetical protein